jgi:hypothetical protein
VSRRSLAARIGAQTTVLAHGRSLFVGADSSAIGASKTSRALPDRRLALLALGAARPGRPHPPRSTGHT